MRLATARPCSSSSARAPARTSRRCAPAGRSSPAAASRRARSASCGSTTQIASVVKSGGKTRRAAKMQTLKVLAPRHPRVHRVQDQGGEEGLGPDRAGLRGQLQRRRLQLGDVPERQPLGPRAPTSSCGAAEDDGEWTTRAVTTGRPMDDLQGPELLDKIAEGTWLCGDPGVQYEDTIHRWHTCPNTAPINASNPCSEYMFLDDSACNLASLNLMKFRREDGTFDVERFRAAVRVFITAQEILVDHASYPTERIAPNSHKFRPLGLGYANLGSLIMASGLPYDCDAGRALAGGDHGDHARPGLPDQRRARRRTSGRSTASR